MENMNLLLLSRIILSLNHSCISINKQWKVSSPWKPTDSKRGQYVGMPCKNIDNLSVSISNDIGIDSG